MPDIKICGLTCKEDIEIVNEFSIAYAGFVLFVPWSKRNLTVEQAQQLKKGLKRSIQSVAVTVSPTLEQVRIIEQAGFDVIQIHGVLEKKVIERVHIPIFRAVNVEKTEDIKEIQKRNTGKIRCYVIDGKNPGSGEAFNWHWLVNEVGKVSNIMLAGGLNEKNVGMAIHMVHPQIVDVSTGVEKDDGNGKDRNKVKKFIEAVSIG